MKESVLLPRVFISSIALLIFIFTHFFPSMCLLLMSEPLLLIAFESDYFIQLVHVSWLPLVPISEVIDRINVS